MKANRFTRMSFRKIFRTAVLNSTLREKDFTNLPSYSADDKCFFFFFVFPIYNFFFINIKFTYRTCTIIDRKYILNNNKNK